MDRLSDLPDELLLLVVHFVLPAELETFAQVSKKMYEFTSPLLPTHRAYIRRYTFYKNDGGASMIPPLLTAIAKDRLIGHYIRHFQLTDEMIDAVSSRRFLDALEHTLLLTLLQESKFLDPSSRTKEKLEEAFQDSECFPWLLLPLLLPLLPNLKTLSISDNTGKVT